MEITISDKIAFIMGAGASAEDKIPQQNQWLEHILSGKFGGAKGDNRKYADSVKELLQKICNKQMPSKDISIESIFNLLETSLETSENIGQLSTEALRNYRDNLIMAIFLITRKGGNDRGSYDSTKYPTSPYNRLGKKIYDYYKGKDSIPLTFITFNYDIMLDRMLLSKYKEDIKDTIDTDYGFEMGSYDLYKINQTHEFAFKQPRQRNIELLHPHGSLNWLLCPTCGKVFTKREKHVAITDIGLKCFICGNGQLSPYLIHPSFDRYYNKPFISTIWSKIEKALYEANKWCIIGYSMPDADRFLQYTLVRSQHASNEAKEIHFVNYKKCHHRSLRNDCAHCIEWNKLESNLNMLQNVHLHKKGFGYFIDKELIFSTKLL